MKDRIILLLAGVVCSLIAWKFWSFLGDDAPAALSTFVLLIVGIDNFLLRRELRNLRKQHGDTLPSPAE